MSPRRRSEHSREVGCGVDCTGEPPTGAKRRLEVHEHNYVRGPNARAGYHNGFQTRFEHSHEGGDVQHEHPDTGPARYTIDKDEWARATGLVGGGRKKYTTNPSGPQLEYVARTSGQSTFEVIVSESISPSDAPNVTRGGGFEAAARMAQQFKMRPKLRIVP